MLATQARPIDLDTVKQKIKLSHPCPICKEKVQFGIEQGILKSVDRVQNSSCLDPNNIPLAGIDIIPASMVMPGTASVSLFRVLSAKKFSARKVVIFIDACQVGDHEISMLKQAINSFQNQTGLVVAIFQSTGALQLQLWNIFLTALKCK